MLFNSYVFVAAYLPLTLAGFAAACRFGRSVAAASLVAASLFFYAWWNPAFLPLLLVSIGGNYVISGMMLGCAGRKRMQTTLVVAGLTGNLAGLLYYKYLASILGFLRLHGVTELALADPILPLGISFFTFTQIGYLLDCRDGQTSGERSLLHYALFVTFFPHLIAGPILHHREIMPQFASPEVWRLRADNLAVGTSIFLLGLLKKTLLADPISASVAPGFAQAGTLTLFPAWHVALCYSLQLYFDFSGYSDMAIGLARLFNLRFPLNFNAPYKAESIIDYWQRWHMTLTRWLTLYLYNPLALAAARRRVARGLPADLAARATPRGFLGMVVVPTVVTIGLAGIWHGSGLTFAAFGLLHAFYLCVNHAWRLWRPGPASHAWYARVGRVSLTYTSVLAGAVLFRASSIGNAADMLAGMVGLHGIDVALPESVAPFHVFARVLWLAALYAVVWGAPTTQQIMRAHAPALGRVLAGPYPVLTWQPNLRWALAFGAAAALALLSIGGTGEFLYFQF